MPQHVGEKNVLAKCQLGRSRRIWEFSIKRDLRETACRSGDEWN
jgi:hypothetical protein